MQWGHRIHIVHVNTHERTQDRRSRRKKNSHTFDTCGTWYDTHEKSQEFVTNDTYGNTYDTHDTHKIVDHIFGEIHKCICYIWYIDMMHMIDLQKSILFVEKSEAQQGNLWYIWYMIHLIHMSDMQKVYYLWRKTRANKATRSGTNRFMIDIQKSILFA